MKIIIANHGTLYIKANLRRKKLDLSERLRYYSQHVSYIILAPEHLKYYISDKVYFIHTSGSRNKKLYLDCGKDTNFHDNFLLFLS